MSNWTMVPLIYGVLVALLLLLLKANARAQRYGQLTAAFLYLLLVSYINYLITQQGTLSIRLGGLPEGYAISFMLDYFSGLMLFICAITVLAVSLYSVSDHTISNASHFYPVFWLLIVGVSGVFSTHDLFNLYVWFEVMIIASFVMIVLSDEKHMINGAIHYVAMSLLATLIMLFSIALLYGLTGVLDMSKLTEIAHLSDTPSLFYPCVLMFILALIIKAALFPYSYWLTESYFLTSISASAIFSGLLTKVGVYAIIRMTTLMLMPHKSALNLLILLSCVSMLSGVFGAISDFNIRRILSFHIVSQVGYMILGLALGTVFTLGAAIFYIVHHILVKTNLFLISGVITRYNKQSDIRQMGGFFANKPMLTILFLISAFSLAGIPPFSGFWAKYLIIRSTMDIGFWTGTLITVLVGFFTLYSMIKIWRYTFLKPTKVPLRSMPIKEELCVYIPLVFLTLITIFLGVYPQWLYEISEKAALNLIYH